MIKLHPSIAFILKLAGLYVIFYGFSLALIGSTVPEGRIYIPFFADQMNLVEGFRLFLLKSSQLFATLAGYESEVFPPYDLMVDNSGIRLVYSCMGYGLMSLWMALVIAYPSGWKQKIVPIVTGLLLINLLNIVRIGGLAMLYSKGNTDIFNWIDHHTLFNLVVYVMMFGVYVIWIRQLDHGKN